MERGIFGRIERNRRRDEEKLYPELALFPTDESRDHAHHFARYKFATTREGRFVELSLRILFIVGSIGAYFVFIELLDLFRASGRLVAILGAMYFVLVCYGWKYINRSGVRRRLRLLLISEGVPICPDCGYDLAGVSPEKCPECGAYPLRQAEQVGLRIPAKLQPHHPQNEIDST